MNRAYSLLDIKSVDDDARVIEGIASTIDVDHSGDIVEPKGAEFSLPLPLLWQHDSRSPIGEVFEAKVTATGIRIKARIPRIAEPGKLKDRIDEAWHTLKNRLVKGLSIGYKPLEAARIEGTFGVHLLRWKWLELSAVTVPDNQHASITLIKSLDAATRAALGLSESSASRLTPGVTGSQPRAVMKTISQQLTEKKSELQGKTARLTELRTKSEAEGGLESAEQTERGTIVAEIKGLNAEIEELSVLEGAQVAQATNVVVKQAAHAPVRELEAKHVAMRTEDTRPKGIAFAQLVRCKMHSYLTQRDPVAIAREQFPDDPRIQTLLKGATTAFTTADGANTGGTELVYAQNLVSEFVEYLRPQTILGKFGTGNVPSLRRVPFNVRITGQSSGASGYWVGQNKQKPVTKFNFNAVTLGFSKVATIAVMSDDLARFSNPSADALVRDELVRALVERLDIDFVDPDKAISANVSPASITNGVSALPSAGSDAADVRADIKSLLTNFITANIPLRTVAFIMTDTTALSLSLMRNGLGQKEFPDITPMGGSLEGIPVIVSEYVRHGSPDNPVVIAVSADNIFLSDDGGVSVDMSREASIEMATDPENDSGTTLSMFQNNLMALRAERHINWAKKRSTAAAYIRNVTWGAASS